MKVLIFMLNSLRSKINSSLSASISVAVMLTAVLSLIFFVLVAGLLLLFLGNTSSENLAIAFCVAFFASLLLAVLLTHVFKTGILKPLVSVNMKHPMKSEVYSEIEPFLKRVSSQRAKLKQQKHELSRAENVRRDFSSNVSHEMKTPLQVISGYAELMKNDMVLPADRQKFAGLIYDEAQAMRNLINDVLTLSKLDESAFAREQLPINLLDVSKRMATRLAGFAKAQSVEIQIEGKPAFISGSAALAEEMVYNLIENAVRYNVENGLVKVNVSCVSATPKQIETLVLASHEELDPAKIKHIVVLKVSDTGLGIPEKSREKVFERFFRLDKSRSKETGGTGLGLAIVKHAVQYHHGTICIEDGIGTQSKANAHEGAQTNALPGTTFTLKFPSAEPGEKQA